mgnify:CR=1 FL=1
MAFNLGIKEIDECHLGALTIDGVYLGANSIFQNKYVILPGTSNFSCYRENSSYRSWSVSTTSFTSNPTNSQNCVGYVTSNFTIDVTKWKYLNITYSCSKIWNTGDSNWNWYNFGLTSSKSTNYKNQSFTISMGTTRTTGTETNPPFENTISGFNLYMRPSACAYPLITRNGSEKFFGSK